MTVCIAALCQNDEGMHAVVASDRMVTLGGFMEFEHTVPKMAAGSPLAIYMVAGDTLRGTRLAQEVAAAVAGSNPPVGEIAQRLAAHYEQTRRVRMEQDLLRPRALDLASFYQSHNGLNPNIVAMIDNQMQQYNLGVELLLAGIDGGGAHIYSVVNPGPPDILHDVIGYAAIGSGAIHAIQALVGFRHSPAAAYHETVFRAYAAKRRAEVAPGVGLDTDMAVISPSTGIHVLTADEMGQLREIYEDFERTTSIDLEHRLADFRLREGQEPHAGEEPADEPAVLAD